MRGRRIAIAERGPGRSYRPDMRPPSLYGLHQPGIATPQLDHLAFAALDLTGEPAGLLRASSAAAGRAMRARDGLTVTIGLGPGLFAGPRRSVRPTRLEELPAFVGDTLDPARCGGDLCLQVCAREPAAARDTLRELVDAAAGAAVVRWSEDGFLPRDPRERLDGRPRDLLGFKSGTNNPRRGRDLDRHVWVGAGDRTWMTGGTYLVVRRIEIDLEAWRALPLPAQERVIGRRRDSGAPLGARREFDPVPEIPADTHVRLASRELNGGATMLRRSYSVPGGLLFLAYVADPRRQYVPVQRRLAEHDPLSAYTRHVGSAVFAIPPGAREKGPLAKEALTWEGEEGRKRSDERTQSR